MDKMRMESVDMTAANIEKIGAMFPNCITETKDENGKPKKAINFELLKQMLSDEVAEGDEAYEFTWVGKKASIVEANKPIRKTLRPCPEESVDWDNTENLYIEGDNLEVLKLLQESYLGKVKMIYIDPPYNTGNDFIYKDNFAMGLTDYNEQVGAYSEETGERLFKNTDTNGRFHSDWCSMIYPRLMLARNLLSDNGVIFISIDDIESSNLRKLCDEIFGSSNFIVEMINVTGASQNGEGVKIQKNTESCLVYAKNYSLCYPNKVDKAEESLRNLNDSPTPFITRPEMGYTIYYNPYNHDIIPIKDYDRSKISTNDINLVYTDDLSLIQKGYLPLRPGFRNGQLNRWRWGIETFIERKNEIVVKNNSGKYSVFFRQSGFNPPKNLLNYTVGTNELKNLFNGKKCFDFPKSVNMIKYLCSIGLNDNDIIIDFFSGSATTAHAVMQLNAEDGGHRKFIMVQIQEICNEKSEAFKAGYKNICEIGKERIRRAGKKIKEENPLTTQDLDVGFRVLKLDDTNMNDVYYSPAEYNQNLITALESNIKSDRTDLDLLFGCLLEWGLPLSLPYSSEEIEGYTVHNYNDGDLIACFDENVPDSVIKEIAKRQPIRAVFRDSSFANSPSKINVGEIFKLMAPDTRVKVI